MDSKVEFSIYDFSALPGHCNIISEGWKCPNIPVVKQPSTTCTFKKKSCD